MSPNDLRKEANAAEFLARLVSDAPGRAWLTAKAEVLRREAQRLETRGATDETRRSA
jgi:hypothetical protein